MKKIYSLLIGSLLSASASGDFTFEQLDDPAFAQKELEKAQKELEKDRKTYELHLRKAEQGVVESQLFLGKKYAVGKGIPKDKRKAFEWFHKAAANGSAEAQYTLGIMYFKGEVVPGNDQKALEWIHKAAEQGYAEAQGVLGHLYLKGWGAPQNLIRAYKWFSLALVAVEDDRERRKIIDQIEELREQMSFEQLTEAQRLSLEWFKKHGR